MRSSPILKRGEALIEAQRCLGCFDPPCMQACPAHVNVPAFIKSFAEDNVLGAGETIYNACPLGLVCGLACPTSDLCEGSCTLNKLGQKPVMIGSLQSYITSNCEPREKIADHTQGQVVAIIGAGPSGLGCAAQLARQGFEVEVFEKSDSIGGLTDQVIPSHRLPSSAIVRDVDRLKETGVKFHLGTMVNEKRAKDILKEFDAVFIGTGLSADKEYFVEGSDAPTDNVLSALDYLGRARKYEENKGDLPYAGKHVVVIGGGNVALDAAVLAKRLGSEQVIVLYRRSKDEMPGWESEYFEATQLGVEFRWLSVVNSLKIDEGKLQSVCVQHMKFTQAMEGGRKWVEPDPDYPEYELCCDTLIYALGQKLDPSIADHFGIEIFDGKQLQVNPSTYQTRVPKVFAAGEVVSGGATIVFSMREGMAAGRSIGKWLLEEN